MRVIKAHSHSALELTWWGRLLFRPKRICSNWVQIGFANFSITKPYSDFEISLQLIHFSQEQTGHHYFARHKYVKLIWVKH